MFLLIEKSDGEKVMVDEKKVSGPAQVGEEIVLDETDERATVLAKGLKRAMEVKAKEKEPAKKEKKPVLKVFMKFCKPRNSNFILIP